MTDPLEALESLVAELDHVSTKPFRDAVSGTLVQHYVHQLEPIIQQLKEREEALTKRDEKLVAEVHAAKFSEREWRDKAQDKIAEVEGLESRLDDCDDQAIEMVKLREQVESLRAERERLNSELTECYLGIGQNAAERERYREALEGMTVGFDLNPTMLGQNESFDWPDYLLRFRDYVQAQARAALQASSPKDAPDA